MAGALPFPVKPEDLSAERLGEALRTREAGVEVSSVEVLELRHGTNSHAQIRAQ